MITQHLRYALRHIRTSKQLTVLNLAGLSIGLACFSLIGAWVQSELNYDSFHTKGDRIYRVVSQLTDNTSVTDQAVTSPPLGPALVNDLPEVERAVRIDPGDAGMSVGDKTFLEEGIITEPSFFEVFDFKLLRGDRYSALTEPYTVVLSESLAKKYFGDNDPVGQLVKIFAFDADGNGAQYKVTGVIEDCPVNSHFFYNYVMSFSTWERADPGVLTAEAWDRNKIYTYILINPDADVATVEAKLPRLTESYLSPAMAEGKYRFAYSLQKLSDVHLRSHLSYEMRPPGSMQYVIMFSTIGIIVLLLASINYINLSTAYATTRFKEVGIHKVLGAMKHQLVRQYLTESWLLAILSLVFAFGWIELLRPLIEGLTQTKFDGLYSLEFVGTLVLITSAVGLLAGSYPSVVLSGFRPIHILKGQAGGATGSWLRRVLVVVQFSVTIVLIIGIIVVQMQMQFIHGKDLGFDKNNLVVFGVHGSPEVLRGYQPFYDELAKSPVIGGVARSNTTIGNGLGNFGAVIENASGERIRSTVFNYGVDYDYLDVYRMELAAGRNFQSDNAADSTRAFIVNEALARTYGYENPAAIVGKSFSYNAVEGTVVGVLKDFNFASLQHNVEPACMYLLGGGFSRISIRINGDVRTGFDFVQATWKKHFPTSVIQYAFYEDTLANIYRAESRFSSIFFLFSMVSLAIACLGLFALVSYTVERRVKEIGIRKVLGASIANILSMVTGQFIWLVVLACLFAIPLGYYFMDGWLSSFAYRIDLSALIFVGAALLVVVIAAATVGVRAFGAASVNPVASLRSE